MVVCKHREWSRLTQETHLTFPYIIAQRRRWKHQSSSAVPSTSSMCNRVMTKDYAPKTNSCTCCNSLNPSLSFTLHGWGQWWGRSWRHTWAYKPPMNFLFATNDALQLTPLPSFPTPKLKKNTSASTLVSLLWSSSARYLNLWYLPLFKWGLLANAKYLLWYLPLLKQGLLICEKYLFWYLPLLECGLLVAILNPWNAKYGTFIN